LRAHGGACGCWRLGSDFAGGSAKEGRAGGWAGLCGGELGSSREKGGAGDAGDIGGARGSVIAIADGEGIFDFNHVPPGTYILRAFSAAEEIRLKEGEALDSDMYVRQ
jgi:hypothetical protein